MDSGGEFTKKCFVVSTISLADFVRKHFNIDAVSPVEQFNKEATRRDFSVIFFGLAQGLSTVPLNEMPL